MIKIRELRKVAGITQEEAAKHLQISRQVFANYENEINQPSPEMLCKIADYFNVTIDYLVGRESEDGLVVPEGQSLSGDEKELLEGFRRLNAAGKGRILGNLEGLLQASALFTDKTAK